VDHPVEEVELDLRSGGVRAFGEAESVVEEQFVAAGTQKQRWKAGEVAEER
jgi:hypothetical protein